MIASNILMVKPSAFAYNEQTAINNAFQQPPVKEKVQGKASKEFDDFVNALRSKNINVTVIEDTSEPHTPDSIFPNNWISFHEDGTVVLYPMFAENRRLERDKNILEILKKDFYVRSVLNLTEYEQKGFFLEGTGSMVLDRDNRLAYACLSPRTNATVLYDFCNSLDYSPVLFNALDSNGREIYHTNVMMCVADEYVVICFESIKDEQQKKMLTEKFAEARKTIVPISFAQLNHFAGNMLQVKNNNGENFLVMSSRAFKSLSKEQIETLQSFNDIIHTPLSVIEQNGGGSARCMMAEIFLREKI